MAKVQDTYNPVTGEYVKRISDWVSLTGDLAWASYQNRIGSKWVRYNGSFQSPDYGGQTYKYDSKKLSEVAGLPNGDSSAMYSGTENITVFNNDSGWSDSYTPSASEVKAYFHGWRMANADGTSPYYKSEVPYTPATWAEWTLFGAGSTKGDTGLHLVQDSSYDYIYANTNLKTSTKYGILYNVTACTLDGNFLLADSSNAAGGDVNLTSVALGKSIGNQKATFTSNSTITNNKTVFVNQATNTNGTFIDIKDIRIFELPVGSQIEADFTNLSADELSAKYTFNGLCTKHWKKVTDGTGLTSTLPTASYAGYTPYRMIYQLATPEISYLTPKAAIPLYDTNTIVETDTSSDCKADVTVGYKLKTGVTAVAGDITAPTPDYSSEVKNFSDVSQSDDFFLRTKMIVTDRADSFYASCPNPPLGAVFNNLNTVTNALAPKVVGATDTYMVDTQSVAWAIISLVKLYNKTGNVLYLDRAKTVGNYITGNTILASFWGTNFTVMPNRYQYTTATGWVKKTEEISVRNQYLVVYALLMLYKASTTVAYKTTATALMTTLGYATAQLNSRCGTTDGIATYMAGAQYESFNFVTETGRYVFSWDTFTHSHADVMVDAIKLYIEQVNNNTLDSSYGVVTPASILSGFATHVKAVQANGKLEMPLIAGLSNKLPYSYLSYKDEVVGAGGLMYPTGKNYDWVTTLTWGNKWFANDQCMWTILGLARLGNYLNDATIKALALAYRNAFLGLKLTSHITYTNVANEVLFYDRYNMDGTPITDDKSVSISATGSFLTLDSELAVNDGALRAKMMYTLGKHQIAQTRNDNKDGGFGWDAVTASYLEVKATGEIWNSPYFEIASKGCKGAKEVGVVSGKNLLPKPTFTQQTISGVTFTPNADGSVTLNGTSTTGNSIYVYPSNTWGTLSSIRKLDPNKTYVIKSHQDVQFCVRSAFSDTTVYTGWNPNQNFTFSGIDITMASIQPRIGVTFNNVTVYPQVEEGITATAYEPYSGYSTANLPTLRKIGAVADSYNPETGVLVQRIGKKVFDGTEAWNTSGVVVTGKARFWLQLTGSTPNSTSISSHFKYLSSVNWTNGLNDIYLTIAEAGGHGSVCVTIPLDISNNSTQFKAYIAQQYANGTPITVYYQLATPVVTTLTATALPTYSPTTVIESDSTVKGTVSADYKLKTGATAVAGDFIASPEAVNDIKDLGNSIDVISSIGRKNIVPNTNKGITGWHWNIPNGVYEKEEVEALGIRAVRVRCVTRSASWYVLMRTLDLSQLKRNTTYTLSFDMFASRTSSTNIQIRRSDGTASLISFPEIYFTANQWTHVEVTGTTNNLIPYDQEFYFTTIGGVVGDDFIIANWKMEESSSASPYTPAPNEVTAYNQVIDGMHKTNIGLSSPLRSVGAVKDRLFKASDGKWKVERNIGEMILNGTENWGGQEAKGEFIKFGLGFGNIFAKTDAPIFVDRYKGVTNLNSFETTQEQLMIYQHTSSNETRITIHPSRLSTGVNVTGFKAWLSSNPITVQYQLATPTYETLSQELQTKLDNIPTFPEHNYVYTVTNDNLQPTLHVDYKKLSWLKSRLLLNSLKIYSRNLTDVEMKQNYRIEKERYGM